MTKDSQPIILAIETSCDETSCAVISGGTALSNVVSSQSIHEKYGGVIPEFASRAHLESISLIVEIALKEADISLHQVNAIAATTSPGLSGALLVGSNFAKGLAVQQNLPIIPVNHIEGHVFSGVLEDSSLEFPFIALVVSGGHTSLFHAESFNGIQLLGSTRDDAAGEAFDKTAKMLGLGYPGGPKIDMWAANGNPKAYDFPRALLHSRDYTFSFSGVKTAVALFLKPLMHRYNNQLPDNILADVCASIQEAIVEPLIAKTFAASEALGVSSICIAGGVSANSRLRNRMQSQANRRGMQFVAPRMSYCIDNAAMIGFVAEKKLLQHGAQPYGNLSFRVNPNAIRSQKE